MEPFLRGPPEERPPCLERSLDNINLDIKCIHLYPWWEAIPLERPHFSYRSSGLTRGVALSRLYGPGADAAVVHVGCDHDTDAPSATFTVNHHHVTWVRVQPRIDGFTNTAQSFQGRPQVIRPTKIQHLNAALHESNHINRRGIVKQWLVNKYRICVTYMCLMIHFLINFYYTSF